MRIVIDVHMIGERESGNETYAAGLIAGFAEMGVDTDIVLTTAHTDALTAVLPDNHRFTIKEVSSSPVKRLAADIPRIARTERADVVHTTYCAPLLFSTPLILTVHDVSFRRHPEWFSLRDRCVLNAGIGISARRCQALLTISQSSADDVINYFHIQPDRVHITPLASGTHFKPHPATDILWEGYNRLGIHMPYILAVGNLQPRKNLCRLLEAYAALLTQLDPCPQLVLVGKTRWQGSQAARHVHELGLVGKVCLTGYVDNDDLVKLYRGADLFVHPALFEGFGLPILEAMACGTPVVTANTSSMPEVASDAAVLVNPIDSTSIMNGMRRVLASPHEQESLRSKGFKRAGLFTWKRTAQATYAAYQQVLEQFRT